MPLSPRSPALLIAAVATATAGVVHAAAAGSHAELPTLSRGFAVAALAQIGWAVAMSARPDRWVLAAGAGLNLAALGTWLASRTVGISFVDGLDTGTTLGLQDGTVIALEVVAVLACLAAVVRPAAARSTPLVPIFAAVMLVATVPAMATPHDHASHDHEATDLALATATPTPTPHDHDHDHDHGSDDSSPVPTPDVAPIDRGYPASFVSWLDTADTPAHRVAAEKLLVETNEAMKAFPDEAAVQAAGYTSIGDGVTGWEHYIHVGLIADPADPRSPGHRVHRAQGAPRRDQAGRVGHVLDAVRVDDGRRPRHRRRPHRVARPSEPVLDRHARRRHHRRHGVVRDGRLPRHPGDDPRLGHRERMRSVRGHRGLARERLRARRPRSLTSVSPDSSSPGPGSGPTATTPRWRRRLLATEVLPAVRADR